MHEVAGDRGLHMQEGKTSDGKAKDVLHFTADKALMRSCNHMLLYLTSQTWTRGEASEALAKEVLQAMDLGVHVLLAHESASSHNPV